MSLIAIAVKHMIAAGLPAETIVAAVAEMEAVSAPAPKSSAAIRQKRYRDAKRNEPSRVMENVTDVTPSPDKEIPPTPPKEINPNPIPPSPPKGGSSPTPERNAKPWVNLQAILNPMTARAVGDHLGSKLTGPMADAMVGVLREVQQFGGNPDEACQMMIRRGWKSLDIEFLRNNGFKFSAPPKPADVDWVARLKAWRDNETWVGAWGPKPGERNCRVPANLLEHAA